MFIKNDAQVHLCEKMYEPIQTFPENKSHTFVK